MACNGAQLQNFYDMHITQPSRYSVSTACPGKSLDGMDGAMIGESPNGAARAQAAPSRKGVRRKKIKGSVRLPGVRREKRGPANCWRRSRTRTGRQAISRRGHYLNCAKDLLHICSKQRDESPGHVQRGHSGRCGQSKDASRGSGWAQSWVDSFVFYLVAPGEDKITEKDKELSALRAQMLRESD